MKYLSGLLLASTALSAQAQVVINEVDADTPGSDVAEFIELYDGGTGNTALDDYVIVLYNGSDDASYEAYDLDGHSTDLNGYFVLCPDNTQVANCDLEVGGDNVIQNGADAVAVHLGSASSFPTDTPVTTANLIDAIVYDTDDADDAGLLVLLNASEPQVNEDGQNDKTLHSNQRCENGSGGARNTSTFIQATPTPGTANNCPVSVSIGACDDPAQLISGIQGAVTDMSNDASSMAGQKVVVEAIVTGDFQGGNLANGDPSLQYEGFWLQEEDADSDGNAQTSEGLFVSHTGDAVAEGDKVRLVATVDEDNNGTQLITVEDLLICSSGEPLPTAATITLPVTNLTDLEAIEGMLVSSSQNFVVSDLNGVDDGLGNDGQFVVSSTLHFQPTEIAAPGTTEYQNALDAKPLDSLVIDDGVSAAYPSFIPFPDASGFSATNPLRIGYTVPSLTGVMNQGANGFFVVPKSISIVNSHPRTSTPEVHADANLIIVGMNVLNYFNGDGAGGGFPTSRGAAQFAAFEMQRNKIVEAITATNADIIGLMEIENDGYGANSAIQDLVTALNTEQTTGNEYSFVDPGVGAIGSDVIAVGLLYRAGKVSLAGNAVLLDETTSPTDGDGVLFDSSRNRPSLIQSFSYEGKTFTVSVNHLKSKGSACGEVNEGADGQGNCNVSRTRAAQGLAQYLATDPTGSGSSAFMILGDLNAYSKEDPMVALDNAGFTNLKYTNKSTETQPYSYSYGGFLGSLDHALVSDSLLADVVSVDAWHINSVEDTLMDYQTEATGQSDDSIDTYANADAFRSSDHDPIVIGLKIGDGKSSTFEFDSRTTFTFGSTAPIVMLGLTLLILIRIKQNT